MATPTGNRCNHDPRRPRLRQIHTQTTGKPFPKVIREFIVGVEQLYNNRSIFHELGERKRSERLEAMVLVAKALGRNCDRLTLRIGRLNADRSFSGIPMHSIARWAGMTVQRAYRALWDLRDMGFIDCTQPVEQRKDGSYRGLAGVRCIRREFFERLGLRARLARDRRELWAKQQADHRVTIADRRRERRALRVSRRAAVLTARTIDQLAAGTRPSPPARVYTQAEIAAMLLTGRRP